jgi:hypothetical protein
MKEYSQYEEDLLMKGLVVKFSSFFVWEWKEEISVFF